MTPAGNLRGIYCGLCGAWYKDPGEFWTHVDWHNAQHEAWVAEQAARAAQVGWPSQSATDSWASRERKERRDAK